MLAQYETLTQALLQAPSSPIPLISTATLDTYINQARLQVAAQGRCIRQYATMTTVAGQRQYPFHAGPGGAGIAGLSDGVTGVYHVRMIWLQLPGTSGQRLMYSRPFEWFSLYAFNDLVPPQAQPTRWSQYGQGQEGSIFVDPIPDGPYTLVVDALGVPAVLLDDTTTEAIPDIWTLAVPFYAAWWGFQQAQRQADADMMLQRFQEQMTLARNAATPDLTIENWSQTPDPEQSGRLGVQQQARTQ